MPLLMPWAMVSATMPRMVASPNARATQESRGHRKYVTGAAVMRRGDRMKRT
jgi:hypothetical protein